MTYDGRALTGTGGPRSVPAYRDGHDGFPIGHEHGLEYDDTGFDFWEAFRTVWIRKWMILAICVVGVAASAFLSLRQTPLYRAGATIEILREDVTIIEGADVGQAPVADAEYLATQYELLQSRALAERVAELNNLTGDERYANLNLPRPERLKSAASKVRAGLQITPEGRSRVVHVEFISPHQFETARIANAVVEEFIQSNLERRYNTTAYAREFIEERLAVTKAALEDKERELVEYAEEAGILDLSVGEFGTSSLEVNSIISLNSELADAESARIEAENRFRVAQSNPSVRELVDNDVIRSLKDQLAVLRADYEERLRFYKPDYPEMVQLQTRMMVINQEIVSERAAILSALESDYRAALAREQSLRRRVATLTSELENERGQRIDYTILQREVDTNRAQYDALLQRQKEVSIAAGLGSSQVSVVDRALPPSQPFAPNVSRSVIQALVLSLAAGLGLAFLLKFLDNSLKTPEDLRSKLGLPVLGTIPKESKKTSTHMTGLLEDPRSAVSEAYFSARTALEYSTTNGTPKRLLLTSTRPGEGKTTSSLALATTYAKNGKNVLIIDADMRKPSFVVDKGDSVGLSGILSQGGRLMDEVVTSSTPNLSVLPSGVIPPNPAELLGSARLEEIMKEAEENFDIVIVDSPPVLSFADAPILGAACDAALIVVQSGSIRTVALERTIQRLSESRTNLLGAILVKFNPKQAGYEYGDYYQSYGGLMSAYVEGDEKVSNRQIRIKTEKKPTNDE